MRIGIIEAGLPPDELVPDFGTYEAMTRRLLGGGHAYETFRAFEGRFPARPEACDAYAITGAAAGVGDGLPWVDTLLDFIRSAAGKAKLVGICFGHQAMAQALGGRVEKAAQGWGLGLHRYEVQARAAWMDDIEAIHVTASHQDQVVVPPPGTRVLAASAFTPYAVLEYTDHAALSVQFHPEFTPDFSRALLDVRHVSGLSDARRAAAVASFDAPNDNARIARWIDGFLAG